MRTTINLDDDVIEMAKLYSKGRSVSLGKAISELVRQATSPPLQTRLENGFHVVVLPPGSPTITSEHVKRLQDELE